MSLNVVYYVLAASFLFIIGAYCLATRKSIIKQIIGLEIMVNAAHLSFVALSSKAGNGVVDPYAMSFIIMSLGVGATVVALALLLTVQVYRVYRTTDVTELRRLRR